MEDIKFKRKIYNNLLNWKEKNSKEKALLIEGARRIGKSTIVEEFGKNEYKSYILIDFNDVPNTVIDAFENNLTDLDTFFMLISGIYKTRLYINESLIIFDEVQKYPKARQSIKKLVKDGRYSYIETGSLISIKENVENITIPSEERSIKMYPMDFEEFCWALNETEMIEYIKKCYEQKKPLQEGMHHKAMMLFKQYMLVGGMPQPLNKYITYHKDFIEADEEKRDILKLYSDDISKIDKKYKAKVSSIFEQIPSFLSKHEKRVRLSNIQKNSAFPMYEETFYWLKDSMICNLCFNCTDPNVGLSINEDRTLVKCYMSDTGLLVAQAFSSEELESGDLVNKFIKDQLSINEGMIFENAIAQCLSVKYNQLYFYTHYNKTSKKNDMEIDFIISNGNKLNAKIIPIEVKSSKNYTTKSLDAFINKYSKRIYKSYIIHTKNYKETDKIVYIPAYMTFCI